ncbi:MAG: preprotein translocase subunit TatA [Nitrospinae bacterium RIFCSPLOWO2_02_FULL_39_110]|nr:MAG: preprotein translocase subunit TatA [Nitrospinae bacterium RIFCSPHIGHO2_02_39_11]OGW01493.1 MAG: preprotein translocase subunit TatA [Nitrospinae bacterium RIFCSPLOWO2_02_39_17]OGW03480.1 MAG: preprotein translocase subunit TatA [Nitrospinae bacterium RIFCSPLOWO2_02_FULL_39_110]OGW08683.1 MAG: preprotein translocase subunit TatA [Nitrospinae bacterium RIFCSPLOWO2_12_FULL_39_93]OGW09441.1 MAG: preprotein translocase subunit TatA [Nitrospinae bacterium RIFCSPLOWO2_12_39_15]
MFYGIGLTELIIILFIILLIFGIGKLPEIGSGVGKAIKNFKKSLKGEDEIDVTPKKDEQ